jgi:cell division protein FtsA
MALVDVNVPDDIIAIPGIGGRNEKSISRSSLSQIIQPRLEEILEIAGIEIKRSGYARHLGTGVVLTGGGSLIPGTAELAADVLGVEARVGTPTGLGGGMVKEVSDPKYATAVGLVLYGLRPEIVRREFMAAKERWAGNSTHYEESGARRIVERMTRWFQEL